MVLTLSQVSSFPIARLRPILPFKGSIPSLSYHSPIRFGNDSSYRKARSRDRTEDRDAFDQDSSVISVRSMDLSKEIALSRSRFFIIFLSQIST